MGPLLSEPAFEPQPLRLISIKDAAEYARVSGSTVRRWIKSGALKTYRAGRQVRIDQADLNACLSAY